MMSLGCSIGRIVARAALVSCALAAVSFGVQNLRAQEAESQTESQTEGQTAAAIPDEFTVAVHYAVDDSSASLSEAETQVLVDTLLGSLAAVQDEIVFKPIPGNASSARSYTFEAGAYGWLDIEIAGDSSSFTARVRAFSVLSADPVLDEQVEGPFDERLRILGLIWEPVAEDFGSAAEAIIEAAIAEQQTSALTFRGPSGTEISGIAGETREIGEDGTVSFELLIPFAYEYEALRSFGYPLEGEVFLGEENESVELNVPGKSRFFFDASLTDMAYPELAAAVHPFGEYFFTQLAIESYLIGFVPIASTVSRNRDSPLFVSEPLSNIHLQLGTFLLSPRHNVRPFVSAGPFMRLVHGPYWGFEAQSPGGVNLRLGAEIGSRSPWRLRLALQPAAFVTAVPDEFAATVSERYIRVDTDIPSNQGGLTTFVNPVSVSVGVRFQPALTGEEGN